MKNITTLSVLSLMVLGSWTAQAQRTATLSSLLHAKKQSGITPYRGGTPTTKGIAARPTEESFYRPIAISGYRYDNNVFEAEDSSKIKWEGNRGNNIDVLSAFELYNFENFHYLLENFDATYFEAYTPTEGPALTQYDGYYAPFGNTPDETAMFYYKNDKKDSVTYSGSSDYQLYRYDDNGNLSAILSYNSGGLFGYDSVVYNSNNLKTRQVRGDMTNKEVHNFYYNGSGKLVAHNFQNIDVPSNTLNYSSSDTIYAVRTGVDSMISFDQTGDPSELVMIYRTNNLIDSLFQGEPDRSNGMTMRYFRNSNNALTKVEGWENNIKNVEILFGYHTNGKINEAKFHQTDMNFNYREIMDYDNNNNLITYTTYALYNSGTATWEHSNEDDVQKHIYYELYEAPQNIARLSKGAVALYPNPASGILNIKTEAANIRSISVYDAMGRIVLQQEAQNTQQSALLNVEQLSNGNYMIMLQTDKGTGTANFVKY